MNEFQMTKEKVDSYGLKELGLDRVPTWIKDKTVAELISLKGKKALVTGAGGDGLGRALSHRLAGLGAEVVMVDRLEQVVDNAKEVAEKWNAKTHPLVGDLLDFEGSGKMFKKAYELLDGRLDILINNAHYTRGGPFDKMTQDDLQATIDGTLTSVVYCCRHACDYMVPQKSGRIINISSEAAMRAHNPGTTLYAAAKAGVLGLTRSLAGELYPHGILVNGVACGIMMKAGLYAMFEHPTPENLNARKSMVKTLNDAVAARVSIPEEVANTVAYLCSDATSYIVGQNIMHGGGATFV